jgi:hypothetical protein
MRGKELFWGETGGTGEAGKCHSLLLRQRKESGQTGPQNRTNTVTQGSVNGYFGLRYLKVRDMKQKLLAYSRK